MPERNCKKCGQPFEQYNSLQNVCPDCEYKRAYGTPKERRKALKHKGKVTHEWLDIDRPKWIKNHPPDEWGFWYCYLGISPHCRVRMQEHHLTLDHVVSRTRSPAKRRKQQNFKPACRFCNRLKGSLSLARIKKLYPNSLVAKGS